jgi:hypothetical protein
MQLSTKILVSVCGLAFVAAASAPAEAAQVRKHKRAAGAYAMASAPSQYRGLDKFPAGPIYAGPTYLGDDPDPFIRSQIARDVNAVYGGNN